MSRTLTALFDNRADADAAKQRLESANIDITHVAVHDQSSAGFKSDAYSTHEDRGFWNSLKDVFLPEEDRHTYEEGVRRGGYLLTAQVDEDNADKAVAILEEASTVDIDERSSQWRASGWNYGAGNTTASTGTPNGAREGLFGGGTDADYASDRLTTEATAGTTATATGEETIPVVQEELKVGKREVERGGVRVRSYVVETPVHESVNLREEHVNVERRAVDQPISAATGDAFRERSIEMTETNEEAVVAKDARVVEEVVISKDVGQRTETVDDTVRRTEVDVEHLGTDRTAGSTGFADTTTGGTGGSGFGTGGTTTDRDRF